MDALDGGKKESELLDDKGDKREIGNEAVWTLSTAKPGNGVEQLRSVAPKLILLPLPSVPY